MTQYQPGDIVLYTDKNGTDTICCIIEVRNSPRSSWYWTLQLKRTAEGTWFSSMNEQSQHQIDNDIWKVLEPLTIVIRYGSEPDEILQREEWYRSHITYCNTKIDEAIERLNIAKRNKLRGQRLIKKMKGLISGKTT